MERALIAAVEAGQRPDAASRLTLSEACTRYYQEVGQYRKSWKDVQRALEVLCYCITPSTQLRDITGVTINDAIQIRRAILSPGKTGRGGQSPTNATINRQIVEFAKAILRRAQSHWGARSLQFIDWREIKLKERKAKKVDIPDTDIDAYFDAISPHHWRDLLLFYSDYGVRLSEAFFHPCECWMGNDDKAKIKLAERKDDTEHVITLTRADTPMMMARKSRAEAAGLNTVWFREDQGKLIACTPAGFRDAMKRAHKTTGIKWTPHDFRHDAARRVTKESGIHTAQKLLGHSSIETTERYNYVKDDEVTDAIEKAQSRKKSRQPRRKRG